ncbi:MAG: tripartite tricarboxylate transporter TctB family protein [Rhodobacteraceae bacterium]|nr:tripartite tricarboxylate transporter TctB family protein [Paracoccaceae bacterium]
MKYLSGRLAFDITLLALAGYGFSSSLALPRSGGISVIGPADCPAVVSALAVICMLVILVQDARRELAGSSDERLSGRQLLAVAAIAALLAVYVAILDTVGFLAATVVFLFLAILACAAFLTPVGKQMISRRLLLNAAAVSVVATGASYAVFSFGFGLVFP